MRGNGRRAAAAAAVPGAVLGLLVLVWAASGDRVDLVRPSGRRYTFDPPPQPTLSPLASASANPGRPRPEAAGSSLDLSWVGDLLAWAVLVAAAVGLLLLVRWAWSRRWRPPPPLEETEADVLPAVAARLAAGAQEQLATVSQGEVRNAIVACWLQVEETIGAAGLPREPYETSAEYVVRVLHRLDLDPRAIGRLAALYREARFSEHPMGEDARAEARSSLELLHDELRRQGAAR